MNKPTGRLENWFLSERAHGTVLVGDVYDDIKDRFVDGTWIHTSKLEEGYVLGEGELVKTMFSSYLLGKEMDGHDEVNHDQG
jgi:hypothetical protein